MSDPLARGLLLFQQERYDLALTEFSAALEGRAEDSLALAWAALSLARLERRGDAMETGRRAVAANPEDAFAHYALATVYSERNMAREAEAAIERALALDPDSPEMLGAAAMIRLSRGKWEEAAEAASLGLERDPAQSLCLNARSMAFAHMGRTEDACLLLEGDLHHDPENPLTLANLGWVSLRRGERDRALDLFSESLRLDPEFEYARTGLLEALRAREPVYGLLLRYFLAMGTLPGWIRWALVAGGYLTWLAGQGLARMIPDAEPWLAPFLVLYGLFAFLSWTARPLVNLLLRLHPLGEAALRDDDRDETLVTAGCLVGALGFGFASLFTGGGPPALAAVVLLTLLVPASAVYACSRGWPRRVMAILVGLLALVGLLGAAAEAAAPPDAVPLLVAYALGFFACQWAARALQAVEPVR